MNIYTVSVNPAIDLFLEVPQVTYDTVLRATSRRQVWAGKGFNVSRTLLRLGTPSLALGFVGGFAGLAIQAGLAAEGIPTDFVTVPEETRTNVMILDHSSGRHLKVNQPGAPVPQQAEAEFLARVQTHLHAGDLWVLSGSLAPGLPPDFYARLIRQIHAQGALALLDTSGAALRAGCAAAPDLVKPNPAEAYDLTGQTVDSLPAAQQAAQAFQAAGARRVALSLGAQGLLYSDENSTLHVCPPTLQVRTAVGAGDALLGGLVWALAHKRPAHDLACWGVATGTLYAQADELPVDAQPAVSAMLHRLHVTNL